MRVERKGGGCLVAAAIIVGGALWPLHAAADEPPSLQATSATPVKDNRIAALWQVIPPDSTEGTPQARRQCTTSYLGDGFWLTAHHCVSHNPSMDGYLEQFDGQRAGIAGIHTLSEIDDLALIETGPGIAADAFDIAQTPLEVGQQATLTGYGETHDYASSATTTITGHRDRIDFGAAIYTDLLEARSATTSRSCSGDSGAPVYIGSTIYAIHTGGGYNPSCVDGKNMLMWHTNIASRADWINITIRMNAGLTAAEKRKAAAGLNAAPPHEPAPNDVDQRTSSHPRSPVSSSRFSS